MNKEAVQTIVYFIARGDFSGPSVELDADIEYALGFWTFQHYSLWHAFQEAGASANPPLYEPAPPNPYSSSLDSALRLVPEGFDFILTRAKGGLTIGAQIGHADPERTFWAETLPLAVIGGALTERLEE